MWSSAELRPYSDPQKPGATILGQEIWVRVHSNTACALYNSCKRNPFVSSVSAMGSPAGFLNFQGHNALNGGHQYISMNFSSNISESLAFADELHDFPYDALTSCEFKTSQQLIHNFTVSVYLCSLARIAPAAAAKPLVTLTTALSIVSPRYFRDLTLSWWGESMRWLR